MTTFMNLMVVLVPFLLITAVFSRIAIVELDRLLAKADVVSLHLAPPKDGGVLLDRPRLEQLKPGAILINTARGGLVDEAALYDLLAAGKLAGAFLDVFADEPYHGPLAELPQVLLTPHIGSYAMETRVRMEKEATERLLEGGVLGHAFDQRTAQVVEQADGVPVQGRHGATSQQEPGVAFADAGPLPAAG